MCLADRRSLPRPSQRASRTPAIMAPQSARQFHALPLRNKTRNNTLAAARTMLMGGGAGETIMADISTEPEPVAPVLVLVVEDETMIQEVVRSALEEAGFGVLVASSGAAAIGLLEGDQGGAIRAVVTDINLGRGTNGWQVARRARELRPEMPLLYVTGGNAGEWAVKGVPQSILINKPFAPAQIVTAVSQVLNAVPSPPVPGPPIPNPKQQPDER